MKPFNTPLANRFPAASLREVGINALEVVQAVNRTERGELDLCVGEVAALGDDDKVANLNHDLRFPDRRFEVGSDHRERAVGQKISLFQIRAKGLEPDVHHSVRSSREKGRGSPLRTSTHTRREPRKTVWVGRTDRRPRPGRSPDRPISESSVRACQMTFPSVLAYLVPTGLDEAVAETCSPHCRYPVPIKRGFRSG